MSSNIQSFNLDSLGRLNMAFKNFKYSLSDDKEWVGYVPMENMPRMTSEDFVEFIDYISVEYPSVNTVYLNHNNIDTLEGFKERQINKKLSLTGLYLRGNRLTDLNGIQYLSNHLEFLDVSVNKINTLELKEKANLKVENLTAYINQLVTLKGLEAFTELRSLDVVENPLKDISLEVITKALVSKGYFYRINLEVKTPTEFSIPEKDSYQEINTLLLNNFIIPSYALKNLKAETLSLIKCKIADFNKVSLDTIKYLTLNGNDFEDISDFLSSCTSLTSLTLKDCKLKSLDFLSHNPRLTELTLERVTISEDITSLQFSTLLDSVDSLATLTINDTNVPFPEKASLSNVDAFIWQGTELEKKFIYSKQKS